MNKVLGLDIGITSVGWSVIDHESGDILDCGVRLFEEGTASNNVDRRIKRSARRLKRRRQNRLEDMKKLLRKHQIIDGSFKLVDNPYEVRVKGLTQRLSNAELATAILHITKRRGSSLEVVEDDESKEKENQKAKSVLSANNSLVARGKHPCQIQLERLKETGTIRGIINNFKTENYITELNAIFDNQTLNSDIISEIIELIKRKRAYYEGPGSEKSPTPYGRFVLNEDGEIEVIDLIEKMRGKCSVFPNESRAPKMAPTADLFNFLNDLNNLVIISDNDESKITIEHKQEIISKYIKSGKHKITPKELAKFLDVNIEMISGFRINKKDEPILTDFNGLQIIAKAILKDESLEYMLNDFYLLDQLVEVLTRTKSVVERKKEISNIYNDLSDKQLDLLSNISGITGYHALSLKAMNVMIPELYETNDNQMQILSKMGLIGQQKINFKGLKNIPLDENAILSPVAKRAHRETFKVINAIRKEYGELDAIVVEMARDKNSEEKKSRIKEEQKRFEIEKIKVLDKMQGQKANAKSLLKARLYLQQEGKSLYSGKDIDLERLLNDPYAYEIDHIIPISVSFDDSIQNKVLVIREENQRKGNRTPFAVFNAEGFGGWSYEEYYRFCFGLLKNRSKREFGKKFSYLVFEKDITKFEVLKEFINRNLVDTRYASRSVLNTLQSYYNANSIPTKVVSVRGAVTSTFRKKLGLEKDREENFYHHAVDATLVAMLSNKSTFYEIMKHSQFSDDNLAIDDFNFIVESDEEFFSEAFMRLLSRVKDVKERETTSDDLHNIITPKISFKVDRKPNRQISDETIYGTREIDGENFVAKKYKDIYDPKFMTLAEIIDGKKGKKEDLLIYRNDQKTYEKLVAIVEDYKKIVGPIDKENPFYWYKEVQNNGFVTKYAKNENGAPVVSLKYLDGRLGNHIDISKNYTTSNKKVVLLQISPYRTDFYKNKDNDYKFITLRFNDIIYSSKEQIYKIDQEKYKDKLKEKGIDDSYKFIFKLNRNDVFEITSKQKESEKSELWRLVGTSDDKYNKIEVRPINRHKFYDSDKQKEVVQKFLTIGRATTNIIKYNVDVLGNMYEIMDEELTFSFK